MDTDDKLVENNKDEQTSYSRCVLMVIICAIVLFSGFVLFRLIKNPKSSGAVDGKNIFF